MATPAKRIRLYAAAIAIMLVAVGSVTALAVYAGGSNSVTVDVSYDSKFTSILVGSDSTVADVLDELDITLDENDLVSPSLSNKVSGGMEISVKRVDVTHTQYIVPIECEMSYVADPTLFEGMSIVEDPGERGEIAETFTMVKIDGTFASAAITKNEVISEGHGGVIRYGTRPVSEMHSFYDAPAYKVEGSSDGGMITEADGTTYEYDYTIDMRATAYTTERQVNKITASGAVAQPGIVAVHSSVLPMGTEVYIVAPDGSWSYGKAVVGDRGVLGKVIDLYFNYWDDCVYFGARDAVVYVLK